MLRQFSVFWLIFCLFHLAVPVQAQTQEGQSDSISKTTAVKPSASKKAEIAAALEDLRYRHLWLAYAFIWLSIFVFMFRTYRLGHENRERLELLKRRLGELEHKDG